MVRILLAIFIIIISSFTACSPTDEIQDDIYIKNLYSYNGTAWQKVGFGNFAFDTSNVTNWNTAFLWGNHASAGYATLTGNQELTNKTLTSSVGKGTWTASGTWTLPAFTLGGNILTNAKIFDSGTGNTNFKTTGSIRGISLECANNGNEGAQLELIHNSYSPENNDLLFYYNINGRNAALTMKNYAQERFQAIDVTTGSEDAQISWYLMRAGTLTSAMYLTSTGSLYIDATYETFDDKDDAMLLKNSISRGDTQLLVDAGIMRKKVDEKGIIIDGKYDLNLQAMIKLLAGAAYQNRDKIDILEKRISELEAKIR
jgi:hypothetical protein